MKKAYLFIIITITAICVVIGSLVHVTGFLVRLGKAGDGVFGFGKNAGKVTETLSEGSFSDLKVELDVGNVVIKSGAGGSVEWNGSEDLKPEVGTEGGKLKIKQKGSRILNAGALGNTLTIVVSTPLDKLDVETDVGNLEAEGITSDKADINIATGNAIIKGSSFGNLEIDANAGNVELSDVSAEKTDVDADAGNIIAGMTGDFKSFKADTDVGNIELKLPCERSGLAMDLKTDLGTVTVNGEKTGTTKSGSGSPSVTARTDLGNINITTE